VVVARHCLKQEYIVRKNLFLFFFLFSVFISWFYFSTPWYPAAKLFVSGNISNHTGQMAIRWNSGHDLNGYEMEKYVLQPSPDYSSGACGVSLTTGDFDNTETTTTQVVVSELSVDGQKVPFESFKKSSNVEFRDDLLFLQGQNSNVQMTVEPKSHLHLEFLTYNYAGKVEINICGQKIKKNLYTSNDFNNWSRENVLALDYWYVSPEGHYTISMDVPRYKINAFRVEGQGDFSVTSFRVVNEFGESIDVENKIITPEGIIVQGDRLDKERIRYFHTQRLALQIVFALVSAFLACWLLQYLRRFHGIRDLFIGNGRLLFWIMFLSCICVSAFWHISFWPGITSTDSLKIWRAAHIPGLYLGDHPPLNVIFYQYLMCFWDNVAVVAVVQNVLCGLLTSHIFFSCYRWGVPRVLVILLFIPTVLSLPIGLYNAILWKDIPFALLTVLLSFRAADLYYQKRLEQKAIDKKNLLFLLIVMLLAAGIRYNGIVYWIVIPILLLTLGMVKVRWKYALSVVVFLVAATIALTTIRPGVPGFTYFAKQSTKYLQQAYSSLSGDFAQDRFNKYIGIFDVNQKFMQWDHVHHCFFGRYGNDFLRRVNWNDTYPYLPFPQSKVQKQMARFAVALDQKSYQSPWVYFSWNPFYMLYLLLGLPFLIRWLPLSAVFSTVLLSQVFALVFLDIYNWRYYYFAFLGINFLIVLIFADINRPKISPSKKHAF
jgi:hypothetical protein